MANRYGQFYIREQTLYGVSLGNNFNAQLLNIVDAVERTDGKEDQTNLNAICRI